MYKRQGLQHAKGKLISFIDSDDTIDKHMYEEMSKQFHKDVDLVMCSYELSFRNIKQPMLFPFPQEPVSYTHLDVYKRQAMHGVDFVFHAAALKQVPSCEFFPLEAVKTNIIGTDNVLSAAIEYQVKRVVC